MTQFDTISGSKSLSGLIFENDKHQVVFANQHFLAIFDIPVSPEKLTGKKTLDIFKTYCQKFNEFPNLQETIKTITQQKNREFSKKIYLTEGKRLELDINPIKDDGKLQGSLWHFRIVPEDSAGRKPEELLSTLSGKEKKLNKVKSRFMSMVAHELRSPLSTMLVVIENLDAYWKKMPSSKISTNIKTLKRKALFMNDIMEKMLNLSLTDLGKINFSPELVNIVEFLTAVIHEKRERPCFTHTITFNIPYRSLWVNIDKHLMKEVFFNILSNSIKYSPEYTDIHVDLNVKQEKIIISIADRGIGIQEEDAANIFEPFYRGNNAGTVRGTGIGLALSREFIRLHGGEIAFRSKENAGTTFFIVLPQANK